MMNADCSAPKYVAVILAIVMAVALVGCNQPKTQGPNALNKQQATAFLNDCQSDIDIMRDVAGQITEFFAAGTVDEDDADYAAIVQDIQDIRDELTPILNASVNQYEEGSCLAQVIGLKQRCAQDLDDILVEIQEILNYEDELFYALQPLLELEYFESDDLAAIYDEIGLTYDEFNRRTDGISPPTYLQYMHEGICEGLNDYMIAMQLYVASYYYEDPLRTNSYEYQLGVLERKIDVLLDEGDQVLDRREVKIDEDVEEIHDVLDGIETWISKNTQTAQSGGLSVEFSELSTNLTSFLEDQQIHCVYEAPDTIIPANYRSLDYIVYMSTWCDNGSADVIISVEIPEITQKYEQKVTLTRSETQIKIHPPLLENAAASLNSSKDAQIIIKVVNADTGKVELQESHSLKIYSRFDMQWASDDGTPYYENILAWVTPEAEEVKELLRAAGDSIEIISEGGITSIAGYQSVYGYDDEDLPAYQAAAIMNALADAMDVKYVMTPFSASGNNMQRVATPAEVINNRSGICIETSVTVAAAIQATNMHAVLIILPTHAQVAIETWYGSGEYYLIETTALDYAAAGYYVDYVLYYLTKEEWEQYLYDNNATAIDCDLAQELGIQSID